MRITRKRLLKLIEQSILEKDQVPLVDLGRYVWPTANPNYKDMPTRLGEKDTPIERKLYDQLHKHFSLSSYRIKPDSPPLDQESVEALINILNGDQYGDVFRRCDSRGRVYRGLRLPMSWLEKNSPNAVRSMPERRPDDWASEFEWNDPFPANFTYSPAGGKYGSVSSWTGSWEAARGFATTIIPGGFDLIPCILHASCETGIFLYTSSFKKYGKGNYRDDSGKIIKSLNPYGGKEREVMLLGECTVDAIQLFGIRKKLK